MYFCILYKQTLTIVFFVFVFFKYFRQEIHQYAQEYVYASFIQQVYTEE
jgi:hypothetical protein